MNDRDIEDTRQPEDEQEAQFCEDCGQEMEYHQDRLDKKTLDIWWKCTNPFCPNKFDIDYGKESKFGSVVKDMANHLAEVEQELKDLKMKLKSKQRALDVISRMTPSQTNVVSSIVLRDTDYAIKRMEDAIEYCEITSSPDFQTLRMEWLEIKLILENG